MKMFLAAALLVAGTIQASAQAQPAPQMPRLSREQLGQLRAACEADVRKLCAGIQPGGGRLIACLRQNAASVSQPCVDTLRATKAAMQIQ